MSDFDFEFEIIDDDEIEKQRRGRKPTPTAVALADVLADQPTGATLRIDSLAVYSDKEKQQTGNVIRNAAKLAGRKVTINWSKSGVPQVTLKQ